MPTLNADFSKISTSFQALPKGDYEVVIDDIEETETRQNKLPMLVFQLSVQDARYPDHEGHGLRDYVTLKTNKGQINKIGYGRVKAYAEAAGFDANGSNIDTDDLKGQKVLVVVKQRIEKAKDESGNVIEGEEPKIFNDVDKVLPIR